MKKISEKDLKRPFFLNFYIKNGVVDKNERKIDPLIGGSKATFTNNLMN